MVRRSKETPPAAGLPTEALTKLQADRLGNVVEALKLRFRISVSASRALKRMLGADASGPAQEEEDEMPPQEDAGRSAPSSEGPRVSPREADHCCAVEFAERLRRELQDFRRAKGPSSAAADAFYYSLGGPCRLSTSSTAPAALGSSPPRLPAEATSTASSALRDTEELPPPPPLLRGQRLRAAHAEAALNVETACADIDSQAPEAFLETLEGELDQLLWIRGEVELIFDAWLAQAEELRDGLTEARAHLRARQARKAFKEERLGEEDLLNVVRALEEHHRAKAGGQGPAILGARATDLVIHREKQTLAHLLHCLFVSSRKWIPRARWSKATLSRRWAKRTVAALVHITFHTSLLEAAETAVDGSGDVETEAVRDALADFRHLKYDRDSTFLLYFSGRIRCLERPARPIVIVLTCSFGGGHRAAAQAVSSYFGELAEVQIIDTSKDSEFLEKDLVHKLGQRIGRTSWDQTTWFNDVILKRQLYGWVNVSEGFGKVQGAILEDGRRSGIAPPLRSPEGDSTLKRILRGQFLSNHPTLVITVYHMDINPIMALCEELGSVPLLHCATDLDVKMWEVFGRTQPTYPKFCVGVPFNVPASWDSVAPLSSGQVFLAGYPVRTQFLAPRPLAETIEEDRRVQGLREGEKLVLIMTGGGGQEVPWPEMLANSTTWGGKASSRSTSSRAQADSEERLRVVVIAGKNAALVHRLERVLKEDFSLGRKLLVGSNSSVSVEIPRDPNPQAANPFFVGASELAALMDIASVAITKPGGGSTSELAYRRVPVVMDASKGAMHWEEFTIKRFEEALCGVALRSRSWKELDAALRQCLAFKESTLAVDSFGALLDTSQRVRQRASALTGLQFRRPEDACAAGDTHTSDADAMTPDAAVSLLEDMEHNSSIASSVEPGCTSLGKRWQANLAACLDSGKAALCARPLSGSGSRATAVLRAGVSTAPDEQIAMLPSERFLAERPPA